MGHKNGLRHAGARGKQVPQFRTTEELAKIQDGDAVDIAQLAREHVEESIQTLVKAQRSGGKKPPPWTVRVRAAQAILEQAGGRPETREPARVDAGLTVIVNKFSTGDRYETLFDDVQMAREIKEFVDAEVVASETEE